MGRWTGGTSSSVCSAQRYHSRPDDNYPSTPLSPRQSLIIYPNAVKDVETAAYQYADLFRDFSAAICQPNSVLVTYGYGYGDDLRLYLGHPRGIADFAFSDQLSN